MFISSVTVDYVKVQRLCGVEELAYALPRGDVI